MSIQNQINRIKGNVDASLLKLQEKGVSVPADANSDQLPELIEQVKTAAGVSYEENAAGGLTAKIG